jgi:hypothetical protein
VKQEGYLLIDNRCAGLGLAEMATLTCSHCTAVVVLNPSRQRERHRCRKCSSFICDGCAAEMALTGRCITMAEKVDAVLEAAEAGTPQIWLP